MGTGYVEFCFFAILIGCTHFTLSKHVTGEVKGEKLADIFDLL